MVMANCKGEVGKVVVVVKQHREDAAGYEKGWEEMGYLRYRLVLY